MVKHLSFLLTSDPLWQNKETLLHCLSPLPLWSASSWSSLMHQFPLHQVSRESFNTSKRSKLTNLTLCFCIQKRAHPQFVRRSFPHLWVEERNSHGLFGPCRPYSQLLPVSVICFRTVHWVWCCPVCKIMGGLNAIKENVCVCLYPSLNYSNINNTWWTSETRWPLSWPRLRRGTYPLGRLQRRSRLYTFQGGNQWSYPRRLHPLKWGTRTCFCTRSAMTQIKKYEHD